MFSKGLTESARKRVELAVAVAQEKLLAMHVDHALDLISLVKDEVSFTETLEIYGRLMRLDDDDAQNITTRALAILGEKVGREPDGPQQRPEPRPTARELHEGEGERNGRSLFGTLRNRLRGRVNDDLRRRIELMAARTEVALIRTHASNAVQFVDILDGDTDERDAVELYLDALDVRESIAEVTYYLALSRIADEILPGPDDSRIAAGRDGGRLPTHAEIAGPLHGD